ncbi:Histidine kinase-, DNA gyrase B-, and HSP90-like ATPase [Amycolatopsis xylanica]|uniref:Histidine kinase-, DNA gyrase B-, and HSP90-like ATPase n=1 Tax=Amycolatopsis xylanica TaxID=589385 RepID=A0A1H3QTM8_9PSEU|nr:GAF domain-containing sensor histidine kinase [Amycolatopsis xylanica]SDZ16874.1 Histidine kinase-, DNA gyrase B-, and HSP90-like ATPase [Amycolatopsis xylanica]
MSQLRLRELVTEIQYRVNLLVDARELMDGLLDAMLAVTSGLELEATLRRVVLAAIKLTDAGYGAIGVFKASGGLAEFVQEGATGSVPVGHGLLSLLLDASQPVRLQDLSKHPAAAAFPGGHQPMGSFIGVPVRVRDRVFGNLYLTDKAGGRTFSDDDGEVLQALAAVAGIAIENVRLNEESRRRLQWRAAADEIRSELLAGADADDVLRLIAERACQLVGADYAFLALPTDPETPADEVTELVITMAARFDEGTVVGRTIPIKGSTCGEAFRTRMPCRASALYYDLSSEVGVKLGPVLALPLRTAGSVSGVLAVLRKLGGENFEAEQVPFVASFTDQAALALQVAREQRQRYELGLLADRERIARDLHDRVIQRLFTIGLSLQATRHRSRSPETQRRLGDGIEDLQGVISDIRTTIFDLHGDHDGTSRLRKRLHEAIAELTADAGLRSVVRLSGPLGVVPAGLADQVEAVMREAISNVLRHARAKMLTVTVTMDDDVSVEVTDDGIGIGGSPEGSGLRNLAERAVEHDGTLTLSPRPGGGTRVFWSVPLP